MEQPMRHFLKIQNKKGTLIKISKKKKKKEIELKLGYIYGRKRRRKNCERGKIVNWRWWVGIVNKNLHLLWRLRVFLPFPLLSLHTATKNETHPIPNLTLFSFLFFQRKRKIRRISDEDNDRVHGVALSSVNGVGQIPSVQIQSLRRRLSSNP